MAPFEYTPGSEEGVFDGRYVLLAPTSPQVGAHPWIRLLAGSDFKIDNAGGTIFRIDANLGAVYTAFTTVDDGTGNMAVAGKLTTNYNILDNGLNGALSGQMFLYSNISLFNTSAVSPSQAMLSYSNAYHTVLGTDASSHLVIDPTNAFGQITLGSGTSITKTANNTVDDGSGNEMAAGSLTLFSGSTFGTNQVFLKAGSGGATLIQTDAGGSVNHLAPVGHYVGLGQVDNSNKGVYVGGGTINMDVKLGTYNAITVAGYGLTPVYAAGLLISLGTTSTDVASYTPTSATGQQFRISWSLACITASTPTLTLTWTDPKTGSQSFTLYNTAMLANTNADGVKNIVATNAASISITGLDSLAAGDIFATATIEELQ